MRRKSLSSLPAPRPQVAAFTSRVTDLRTVTALEMQKSNDISFIAAVADLDRVAVQVFTGNTNCYVQANLTVEQARLYMKHLKTATQQAERNLCTIAKALMRNAKP
ncbi:MAG TPA: hypothetical protein VKZ53_22245 [Candidatus Angelobacter sp.]|nr:hypothetical protein [Candidatus Angelobacter sp.]